MIRRLIHLILILIVFIGYYVITDPQLGIITDLRFGADLILALNFIVIASIGAIVSEISFRLWSDKRNEYTPLEDEAIRAGQAGYIYIGNSIRLLAYAIIISCSIMAIF
jgi:hypothetical protein